MQLVSMIINIAIAILSPAAWLMMVFGADDQQRLSTRGKASLQYFTVLSNLFSGLVSAIYLVCALLGHWPPSAWLVVLKLAAAAAVALTFLVTAFVLTPTYGWRPLYKGGNFWLHLVLPLLAALDCVLFLPSRGVPMWTTLLAMLPVVAYGVFYLGRIFAHGAEQDGVVYDFYHFLRWGKNRIPIVFACMLGVTWLVAWLLMLASSHFAVA